MKKDTNSKKPFFARLLEEQELEKVSGGEMVTLKYPSDSDEATTLKYPSDTDEATTSVADQTMKYPSDSDELA